MIPVQTPELSVAEIERCAKIPHVKGLKLHVGNSRVAIGTSRLRAVATRRRSMGSGRASFGMLPASTGARTVREALLNPSLPSGFPVSAR